MEPGKSSAFSKILKWPESSYHFLDGQLEAAWDYSHIADSVKELGRDKELPLSTSVLSLYFSLGQSAGRSLEVKQLYLTNEVTKQRVTNLTWYA